MDHLIGKVVRLHSKTQPDRFKLYMVTNNDCDGFASGHVRHSTVKQWVENGLNITVFKEDKNEENRWLNENEVLIKYDALNNKVLINGEETKELKHILRLQDLIEWKDNVYMIHDIRKDSFGYYMRGIIYQKGDSECQRKGVSGHRGIKLR